MIYWKEITKSYFSRFWRAGIASLSKRATLGNHIFINFWEDFIILGQHHLCKTPIIFSCLLQTYQYYGFGDYRKTAILPHLFPKRTVRTEEQSTKRVKAFHQFTGLNKLALPVCRAWVFPRPHPSPVRQVLTFYHQSVYLKFSVHIKHLEITWNIDSWAPEILMRLA